MLWVLCTVQGILIANTRCCKYTRDFSLNRFCSSQYYFGIIIKCCSYTEVKEPPGWVYIVQYLLRFGTDRTASNVRLDISCIKLIILFSQIQSLSKTTAGTECDTKRHNMSTTLHYSVKKYVMTCGFLRS